MSKKNEKKKVLDLGAFMKSSAAVKIIVYGALALITLFFLTDIFSSKPQNVESNVDTVAEHEQQLEEKLQKAIRAIDGVGELTIVVTLDSLSETVYSERGTGVKTVITPKVRGVAIICEGGGDIVVKQKIVELTSRVLGINTTRISVTN